jgi:hypothetical protein
MLKNSSILITGGTGQDLTIAKLAKSIARVIGFGVVNLIAKNQMAQKEN